MPRETIDDVLKRLSPEQIAQLKAHAWSEFSQRGGRAGRGAAKRRPAAVCRRAQKLAAKARKRNKQKQLARAA